MNTERIREIIDDCITAKYHTTSGHEHYGLWFGSSEYGDGVFIPSLSFPFGLSTTGAKNTWISVDAVHKYEPEMFEIIGEWVAQPPPSKYGLRFHSCCTCSSVDVVPLENAHTQPFGDKITAYDASDKLDGDLGLAILLFAFGVAAGWWKILNKRDFLSSGCGTHDGVDPFLLAI